MATATEFGQNIPAKWSVQIAGMIFKQILVHRKLSFCYIDAADEKSDKSIWQLLNIRCTSLSATSHDFPSRLC